MARATSVISNQISGFQSSITCRPCMVNNGLPNNHVYCSPRIYRQNHLHVTCLQLQDAQLHKLHTSHSSGDQMQKTFHTFLQSAIVNIQITFFCYSKKMQDKSYFVYQVCSLSKIVQSSKMTLSNCLYLIFMKAMAIPHVPVPSQCNLQLVVFFYLYLYSVYVLLQIRSIVVFYEQFHFIFVGPFTACFVVWVLPIIGNRVIICRSVVVRCFAFG